MSPSCGPSSAGISIAGDLDPGRAADLVGAAALALDCRTRRYLKKIDARQSGEATVR
jgi:hypothetical protein